MKQRTAAVSRPAGEGASRVRRAALRTFVAGALVIVLGVLWQAFVIVAYVRGAGAEARDLHVAGAYVVHTAEFVVALAAVVGFWGDRWRVAFAAALPVYGTVQVFVIGDTDRAGGWVNGLHGMLALVVLLQAGWLCGDGVRALRGSAADGDRGAAASA